MRSCCRLEPHLPDTMKILNKTCGLNLVLVVAALTVALIAVECGIRLLAPQPPIAEWFTHDARYGFFLKPNFHQSFPYPGSDFVMEVRTNSLGLRDIEPQAQPAEPGKTILLLGDSFVFGYGVNVEDRIDARLRDALRHMSQAMTSAGDGASTTRVINAGVPGWGTELETQFARDHLAEFRPDVIVLVFCANDPGNDRGGKLPALSNEDSILYAPKMVLRQHSHAYRWLSKQAAILRYSRQMRAKLETSGTAAPDTQSGSIITPVEWERTLQTIRAFHADYLAFNPAGILVVLASAPENAAIRTRLRSLDNGQSLFYLDLRDAYLRLPPEERVTPWDRHWAPAVHRLAADALFDFINQHELLGS